MRNHAFILALVLTASAAGCTSQVGGKPRVPDYGDLPGPPINTFEATGPDNGHFSRSRGTVDIHLSPDNPSMTFWNDPETRTDPWGTITLVEVKADGAVVIRFGEERLSAKPGRAFRGTGIVVVDSDPGAGTAWLRSRWVHTVIGGRPERAQP